MTPQEVPETAPTQRPTAGPLHYGFVMNLGGIEEPNGYELARGHHLRRAAPVEAALIHGILPTMPSPWSRIHNHLWPTNNSVFVIEIQGDLQLNLQPDPLHSALDLAPTELEIGFMFGRNMSWQPDHFYQTLRQIQDRGPDALVQLSTADAAEIARIHTLVTAQAREPLFPAAQIQNISELKTLPHNSPLRLLGYFAVLEAMLTHVPKPEDRYDSITRQIKKKLSLLNSRLSRPIDYSPFGKEEPEKVWAEMYGYRSTVAHGGTPDFKKKHRTLRSLDCALNLVKETVKAVITHALREPELVRDLREC
jgi:hypothetical protein